MTDDNRYGTPRAAHARAQALGAEHGCGYAYAAERVGTDVHYQVGRRDELVALGWLPATIVDVNPKRPSNAGRNFEIVVTVAALVGGFALVVSGLAPSDVVPRDNTGVIAGVALIAFGLWRAVVQTIRANRKP